MSDPIKQRIEELAAKGTVTEDEIVELGRLVQDNQSILLTVDKRALRSVRQILDDHGKQQKQIIKDATGSYERIYDRMTRKLDELHVMRKPTDPDQVPAFEQAVDELKEMLPELAKELSNKRSEYDPKKKSVVPSFVEDIIEQVSNAGVRDSEIFISTPTDYAVQISDALKHREEIVEEAMHIDGRSVRESCRKIVDAMYNDGITYSRLKRIAAMSNKDQVVGYVREILELAGLDAGFTGAIPNRADVYSVVTTARAILNYIYKSGNGEVKRFSIKTPFSAWQERENIKSLLKTAEPVLVNPEGYDSTEQMAQFMTTFPNAEIVLWNNDIWKGGTRGFKEFIDSRVTKDIVEGIVPMFWQFELPFVRTDAAGPTRFFEINSELYECVGFVVMPMLEERIKVEFDQMHVNSVTHLGEDKYAVNVNLKKPEIQNAFNNALESGPRFQCQALSISSVFLPLDRNGIPEIRFLKPLIEGDTITNSMYALVIAACRFLNEKYVSKESKTVSNQELKKDRQLYKKVRHGKVQVPPIKVINLRRAEQKERIRTVPSKRNWTCHWFVDPHWQHYWINVGGTKVKQLKYKWTYVKGDTSKPLKPPREKVYKAVR